MKLHLIEMGQLLFLLLYIMLETTLYQALWIFLTYLVRIRFILQGQSCFSPISHVHVRLLVSDSSAVLFWRKYRLAVSFARSSLSQIACLIFFSNLSLQLKDWEEAAEETSKQAVRKRRVRKD